MISSASLWGPAWHRNGAVVVSRVLFQMWFVSCKTPYSSIFFWHFLWADTNHLLLPGFHGERANSYSPGRTFGTHWSLRVREGGIPFQLISEHLNSSQRELLGVHFPGGIKWRLFLWSLNAKMIVWMEFSARHPSLLKQYYNMRWNSQSI